MADVLGSRLLTAFGLLVAFKAVDVADRGGGLWLALAWAISGALLVCGRRSALPIVSLLAALTFLAGIQNQHLWLFLWLPATFLVSEEARFWLWRWQATILYGFAAVAKLTPDYLTGRRLAHRLDIPLDILVPLAIAGLLVEAFLAFGLWRWWWAKLVGLGFHVSLVIVMTQGPVHTIRLAIFGGLVLLLYAAFPSRRVDDVGVASGPGVVVGVR